MQGKEERIRRDTRQEVERRKGKGHAKPNLFYI